MSPWTIGDKGGGTSSIHIKKFKTPKAYWIKE